LSGQACAVPAQDVPFALVLGISLDTHQVIAHRLANHLRATTPAIPFSAGHSVEAL
jgi:hypothetical protein